MFVGIDASREAGSLRLRPGQAFDSYHLATLSVRSLRMTTLLGWGSCFPTLAKLGWGTHVCGD
jgi:hypothetical protein